MTRTVTRPLGSPRRSMCERSFLPRRTAARWPLTVTVTDTRRRLPLPRRTWMVNDRRLLHERVDGRLAGSVAVPVVGDAAVTVLGAEAEPSPAPAPAGTTDESRTSATHVIWCWWPLPSSVSSTFVVLPVTAVSAGRSPG